MSLVRPFFLVLSALAALAGNQHVSAESGPLVINARAFYPEGPLGSGDMLYYAEMPENRVVRWDGGTSEIFWSRDGCGPTSIAPYGSGGFVILCHYEDVLVHVNKSGRVLNVFRRDEDGKSFKNPNDSVSDGRGGVYFSGSGIFRRNARARGTIYHLGKGGRIRKLISGLRYANGVVMAEDGTRLFVSEHLARRVLEYSVEPDGSLSFLGVYVELDEIAPPSGTDYEQAGPDGLEVDAAGNLYICEYGAGRVLIVNSQRELAATVPFSALYLTNIALDETERWMTLTGAFDNRKRPLPGKVERIRNPLAVSPNTPAFGTAP